MHVRVRPHPDTMCPMLTMVIGPFGYEDWSPALEKVWREQQAKILDEALSRSLFIMRVKDAALPRVIVEWPDRGYRYALYVDNGIAQWVWISDNPGNPPGIQIHSHHFTGGGQLVPITNKTLRIIEAFAAIHAPRLGCHYLPCQSHGHCVVNLWLKFDLHSDSSEAREYMSLTVCDDATIKDVFRKISGIKAEAERFCLMPINWVNGILVKGSPISYQCAIDNGIVVNDLGWGEEVWLWPCAPKDELISYDGIWQFEDLLGFPFYAEVLEESKKETDDSGYSSDEWRVVKMGEVSMKNIDGSII
ncbi:hypothetical protein DFP73DRAFT_633687 [Morchella snyderi]|nr:hypothetical protein DFP73DRAFT_633687 [Morchella snyderi]